MPEIRGGKTYYKQDLNTFEEQQRELAPINQLLSGGQYRDINFNPVMEYRGGAALEDVIAKIKGTPVFNPAIGPQVDYGQGRVPFTGKFTPPTTGLSAVETGIKKAQKTFTGIQKQAAPLLGAAPGAPNEAKDFEKQTNDEAQAQFNAIASKTGRGGFDQIEELKKLLATLTPKPATVGAETKIKSLISEYQTPAENDFNTAKADLKDIENQILTEQEKLKGQKGVSSRYIGRQLVQLSEERSQALRTAEARVQSTADRLNSQQRTVSMMMDAYKWDYQEAQQNYQFEYSKTLQLITAVKGWYDKERDDARADFTTMSNLVNKNPEAFKNPTQEQKIIWNDIELKNNYPLGTIEGLAKAAPGFTNIVSDESYDAEGNKIITFIGIQGGKFKIINEIVTKGVKTNYNDRLKEEIVNLYSGRYGTEGAREKILGILKSEFPNVDVAKDIYNRIPDGYEKAIKTVSVNIWGKMTPTEKQDILGWVAKLPGFAPTDIQKMDADPAFAAYILSEYYKEY